MGYPCSGQFRVYCIVHITAGDVLAGAKVALSCASTSSKKRAAIVWES